jgi:hypothetical protein
MNTLLIYVATATLGIQTGWERLPEGGMEYVIQLDAAALNALRDGQAIQSDIPSAAGEIRSYRIYMGNAKPQRQDPPLKLAPPLPPAEKPAASKPVTPLPETPTKPWLPFMLTLLTLFASIGANVFLGWIVWGLRKRSQNA